MKREIGITSGCFDLPHPTHVEYLNKCKRQCKQLIVLVDSDRLVTENKRVPILSEQDRKFMIENFKAVDKALIFDNLEEFKAIVGEYARTHFGQLLVFKNSDKIYGKQALEIEGAQLVLIPDVKRFASTTDIINHLKQL